MSWLDWFRTPTPPPLPSAPVRVNAPDMPPIAILTPTSPSAACIALIEEEEKCILTAYPDVDGVYVLGYGDKIFDGKPVVKGQTTDKAGALRNMKNTAQQCADAITSAVTAPITQGQLDALTDFVYNVGLGGFLKSTILRTLNAGQPVTEAMFTVWNKITKNGALVELPNLTRRREREYQLFIS